MAAEIVNASASGIASKVAESFYDMVQREMSYVFKYQRYLEEKKKKLEKLKSKKEMMEQQVKRARRQGEEIYKSVEEWQNEVIEFIERVEKSMEEEDKAQTKRCLKGMCPNLMSRYNLSKKAVKVSKDVDDLLEKVADVKLDTVSYQPSLPRTGLLNDIEGCQQFDSRMNVFRDVIDELKVSKFNRIGVHGIGGVGKTTLAKQVAKKVMEEKLFDEVVMAEVTETPDLKTIQDEIACDLGLVFDQNLNLLQRASKLCQRLGKVKSERSEKEQSERIKKGKKILVILDNVWSKINLEEVGIPTGDDNGGRCTILLTSRSLNVLSSEMNSKKNFPIDVLSHEESMDLFWKSVDDPSKQTPGFQSSAVEIVRKLGCLPIAIKTVANAIKNKPLPIWENALIQLRNSNARQIPGMEAEVYSPIKLSYDFLQSGEAKSLFRLCALQKDGSRISINDLVMHGMGLNLFANIYSLKEGRSMVHALIDTLKSSCLLLDGDTEDDVKMHDVVHAVAVSIVTDEHMLNILNVAELKEWEENKIQDATAISLPYTNIQWLPERLIGPKLELFLLFAKHENSFQIPNLFFERMKELRVLHITEICLHPLPSSLGCLVNLRTLSLINCHSLKDAAIVGKLRKLEILSFRYSDIEELPVEIGQLAQLKLLDLGMCLKLTLIAANVISKLSQLEELYVSNSFTRWETVEGQSRNVSLVELRDLPNLKALDIRILDIKELQDLFFVELERYKIFIGDDTNFKHWSSKYETSRSLKLKVNDNIYLGDGIRMLMKKAEDLCLDTLNSFQSVLPELDGEGFPRLKNLFIQNNDGILYIFNSVGRSHCNAFPSLESLFLYKLIKLEKICQGQLIEDQSFSNLTIIRVEDCHRLKHLFSLSVAKNLLRLQEIRVSNCNYLKVVVGKESEIHVAHEIESFSEINFIQLRCLSLKYLPQLTSSGFDLEGPVAELTTTSTSQKIIAEDDLKTLFNNKVIFPKVETLELSNINIEKIWLDQFPARTSCSQYLIKLTVSDCDNLKSLFSPSMVNSLVELQELVIIDCESIEGVMDIRLFGRESEMIEIVFPKLVRLQLLSLPKLTTFGIANSIKFPSLRELHIGNCKNLKRFISSSTPAEGMSLEENIHTDKQVALFDEKVKLPSLEILILWRTDLIKIWHHQLDLNSFSKLRELKLGYCFRLVNIFPFNMWKRFERVEELDVSSCDQLEEIIEKRSCNGMEISTPSFVFPRLTSLRLFSLTSLKNFYPKIHVSEFPVLEELEISHCENVKILASELLSPWENQHEMAFQQQPFFLVKQAGLSSLKKLVIYGASNMKIWYNMQVVSESHTVRGLLNLEKLVVNNCDFGEINELIEKATQLKILNLFVMDHLKQIWPMSGHQNIFQAFQNLISIYFYSLPSLKSLFPVAVARCLFQLEELSIVHLSGLEEVVAKEEGVNQAVPSYKFVFPRLISLRLDRLPSLKSFYRGLHISDWPKLKKLEVSSCSAVKILASTEDCQQPLFLVDPKVAFPSLEDLELDDLSNLLHLWKENSRTCNVFQNLRILKINKCSVLQQSIPSSIYLKYLTTFKVAFCEELRNSVTVSSNIATVNVESCNKLKNLMTLSTTESEVKIESINIDSCKMLKNIIELPVGEEVKENPIVFSRLESLDIYSSSKLQSFCSGNYSILEFPYLKKVVVCKCPNMKIFSEGDVRTPKLHKVNYTNEEDWYWEGNLNSTIQKMFKELVGYIGIDSLKLSELPQAKEEWHSQALPVNFFSNLRLLVVDNCTFMLSAIPANLLRFLNNLKTLEVRNCDSMQEVFHLEEVNADGHFERLFPKLERLMLLDLPKLKRFCNFTKDIIELPNLLHLWIENCPNLETFISDSTQVDIIANKEPKETTAESEEINILTDMQPLFDEKVVSLCLQELRLSKLPKLLHLCKENSHPIKVFQNLKILQLSECHKLEKLVPSSLSFINLRNLDVSKCDGLINLVTLSTAKSLVNLEEMKIIDCKMIKEIIELQVEEEVKEDHIVFSKLEYLELDHLPSLTSFYLGNYTLEFPYLEKVIVRECSKLKIFSLGVLRTPKLQRLHLIELEDEGRWEEDLNCTIQKLFEEMDIKEEDMSMELILDIQ